MFVDSNRISPFQVNLISNPELQDGEKAISLQEGLEGTSPSSSEEIVNPSLQPINALQEIYKKFLAEKKNDQKFDFHIFIEQLPLLRHAFRSQPSLGTECLGGIFLERLRIYGGDFIFINYCSRGIKYQTAKKWLEELTFYINEGDCTTAIWTQVTSQYIKLYFNSFSTQDEEMLSIPAEWMSKLVSSPFLSQYFPNFEIYKERYDSFRVSSEEKFLQLYESLSKEGSLDTSIKAQHLFILYKYYNMFKQNCFNYALKTFNIYLKTFFQEIDVVLSPEIIHNELSHFYSLKVMDLKLFLTILDSVELILARKNLMNVYATRDNYIQVSLYIIFRVLVDIQGVKPKNVESQKDLEHIKEKCILILNNLMMFAHILDIRGKHDERIKITKYIEKAFNANFDQKNVNFTGVKKAKGKKNRKKQPPPLTLLSYLSSIRDNYERFYGITVNLIFNLRFEDTQNIKTIFQYLNASERILIQHESYVLRNSAHSFCLYAQSKGIHQKIVNREIGVKDASIYFKEEILVARKDLLTHSTNFIGERNDEFFKDVCVETCKNIKKILELEPHLMSTGEMYRISTLLYKNLVNIIGVFCSNIDSKDKLELSKLIFKLICTRSQAVSPFLLELRVLYSYNGASNFAPYLYFPGDCKEWLNVIERYFTLEEEFRHDYEFICKILNLLKKGMILSFEEKFDLIDKFTIFFEKKHELQNLDVCRKAFQDFLFILARANVKQVSSERVSCLKNYLKRLSSLVVIYDEYDHDAKFSFFQLMSNIKFNFINENIDEVFEHPDVETLVSRVLDCLGQAELQLIYTTVTFPKSVITKLSVVDYPFSLLLNLLLAEKDKDSFAGFKQIKLRELEHNYPEIVEYYKSMFNNLENIEELKEEHTHWISEEIKKMSEEKIKLSSENKDDIIILEQSPFYVSFRETVESKRKELETTFYVYENKINEEKKLYFDFLSKECNYQEIEVAFETLQKKVQSISKEFKGRLFKVADAYETQIQKIIENYKLANSLKITYDRLLDRFFNEVKARKEQIEVESAGLEAKLKLLDSVMNEEQDRLKNIFNESQSALLGNELELYQKSLSALQNGFNLPSIKPIINKTPDTASGVKIRELEDQVEQLQMQIRSLNKELKKTYRINRPNVSKPEKRVKETRGPIKEEIKVKTLSELWTSLNRKTLILANCRDHKLSTQFKEVKNILEAFDPNQLDLKTVLKLMMLCCIREKNQDGSHRQFDFVDERGNTLPNSHVTFAEHTLHITPEFLYDALRSMYSVLNYYVNSLIF